ncbi:hypothetical protein ACIA49_03920 [Kribbella sp. NPDC051587]|uniref:hypothetical protein n=1 Tax=Kribbella sp. NPDC051587 TaxID=3364119 RepID=UPI0037B3CA11
MITLLSDRFDVAAEGLRAWRQKLLVGTAGDRWMAYFDCGFQGTDAVSTVGYLAEQLKCQGLARRVRRRARRAAVRRDLLCRPGSPGREQAEGAAQGAVGVACRHPAVLGHRSGGC